MHNFFTRPAATAQIKGGDNTPELFGTVEFYQRREGVLVVADISNLPKGGSGFFGFHIHEGDNCSGDDFSGTEGHYNPDGAPHPSHAGDLPPLIRYGTSARFAVLTDRFRVEDIIGRTVVIHSATDDFISQPGGNSGNKIACGIILRK